MPLSFHKILASLYFMETQKFKELIKPFIDIILKNYETVLLHLLLNRAEP